MYINYNKLIILNCDFSTEGRQQFFCRSNEKNFTVFNLEKGRCFHANDQIKGILKRDDVFTLMIR